MKQKKKKINLGLIQLRKKTGTKPIYHCENCNCDRYSPCKCMRKQN